MAVTVLIGAAARKTAHSGRVLSSRPMTVTVRVLAERSEALAEEVGRLFTNVLATGPEDRPPMLAPKLCEVEYLYEGGDVE
jgi:hypothetical protein